MQNKPRNARPGTGRPNNGNFNRPRPAGKGEVRPRGNANPRRVAVEVVDEVLKMDANAALSLDDKLNAANVISLDRRLCASIVYRTLENLYTIDFALSGFLRDADALEPTVLQDRSKPSAIIEDNVLLTDDGCVLISKRQTALIEIPYRTAEGA